MLLVVACRHAESTLNVERRVNGDPSVPVSLTERGVEEARRLGAQLAGLRLDGCVHTHFPRTRQTAEVALAGREVALEIEPLLDDVDVGRLEGGSIDEYRAWKRRHTRTDAFPGGESLDEAARRYARGYRKLLEGDARTVLVVCHEVPIRYAVNAAAGSDDLDGPFHDVENAAPFLFDERALERAVAGIERLSRAR